MEKHPAELDDETLVEWIGDCLCVAERAEHRRDWDLYREARAELRALTAECFHRGWNFAEPSE